MIGDRIARHGVKTGESPGRHRWRGPHTDMARPLPPTNDLRRVTRRTLKPPVRPWQPDTALGLNRGNFHFIFLLEAGTDFRIHYAETQKA